MSHDAFEVNLDGLVGPTHSYAGMAHGNLAAQIHSDAPSNPRAAALQGLAKMKRLMDLGLPQIVLPPHARPDLALLRDLGFTGDDAAVLATAQRDAPHLLTAAYSASSMWAANAATVSPSTDTADGRVHFTPANLVVNLHRAIEAPFTATILRTLFADDTHFAHHPPVPAASATADEGAANHLRLAAAHGRPGIEMFVWGRDPARPELPQPQRFAARQTRDAAVTIARRHGLESARTLFVQQRPRAIDAGVFHNDVIAVANERVLLCHESAWVNQRAVRDDLHQGCEKRCGFEPVIIEVSQSAVPLDDAVQSYLFNSQLVTLPDGSMTLLCPAECEQIASTAAYLESLTGRDQPIADVQFVDVRQSMQNGGGPACLRLRVVLTDAQWQATHDGVKLTPALYDTLCQWVNRHYREHLTPADLSDPALTDESRTALAELSGILDLGSFYPFQRG